MLNQDKIIHISACLILNQAGQMLLVRKQGSDYFMQAGGKIESNESPIDALIRELKEELNLTVTTQALYTIGQYSAPAANEPGYTVNAHVFYLKVSDNTDLRPNAELEQVSWFDIAAIEQLQLAPLTRKTILPITKLLYKLI